MHRHWETEELTCFQCKISTRRHRRHLCYSYKCTVPQHLCENLCQVFTVQFSNSGTLLLGSDGGDCWRQPPKHCSPPTHTHIVKQPFVTRLYYASCTVLTLCSQIHSLVLEHQHVLRHVTLNRVRWDIDRLAGTYTTSESLIWKEFMVMGLAHFYTLIQTNWDQDAHDVHYMWPDGFQKTQTTIYPATKNPEISFLLKSHSAASVFVFLAGYSKTKVDALLSKFCEIILSALLSLPLLSFSSPLILFLCLSLCLLVTALKCKLYGWQMVTHNVGR